MTDNSSFFNFFSFDPASVHSTTDDGKQWFLASTVFSELAIDLQGNNAADYLNTHCEDAEAHQRMVLVNGVPTALVSDYIFSSLILQSGDSGAEYMQESITHAAIKGIHRAGENLFPAN